MFTKAIQKAKSSIFPIILTKFKDGQYQGRQVAGTGFFIDEEGHFLSALHVLKHLDKEDYSYGSLGNVPHVKFKGRRPEKIQVLETFPELDLLLGKLDEMRLAPLPIAKDNAMEGTSLVIGGYPFPRIKKKENGHLNFYTVRQYWQSAMLVDQISLRHFNRELTYSGFIIDQRTIPGMSGGPAINLAGEVIGMCTAHITRQTKDAVPVINGVCLDLAGLKEAIQLITK